ncbi:MAG: hypothetical protein KDA41_16500, partial [Planctomycetales bacterium]|nr:hypothetical protein [Planctomycetales bacterium]
VNDVKVLIEGLVADTDLAPPGDPPDYLAANDFFNALAERKTALERLAPAPRPVETPPPDLTGAPSAEPEPPGPPGPPDTAAPDAPAPDAPAPDAGLVP